MANTFFFSSKITKLHFSTLRFLITSKENSIKISLKKVFGTEKQDKKISLHLDNLPCDYEILFAVNRLHLKKELNMYSRIERDIRQCCVFLPDLFNISSKAILKELQVLL